MGLLRRRTRKSDSSRATPTPSRAPHEPSTDDIEPEFDALLDREWERLANPGTWWTGAERVTIAAEARAAVAGEPETGRLGNAPTEAARRVAAAPAAVRAADVDDWDERGMNPFAFVELVGIVSRLIALDVASFGLGRELRPLPDPAEGEPTRERPEDAEVTSGWAPTVGPATAPSSLSAVPPEAEAMFDLHGVLYASIEQMFDLRLDRNGLNRPQIELVAARTSRLNDCFY